ncbi:MAG: hydrolase [Alphaproteobacteria bacterium]|nr:hydrolase [Alphaproteobacteria bacterium]
MHEKTIDVPTADGAMETFITHPERGGPFPPVIVYMDIWGVRDQLRDIARRIGCVGYVAVLPNLYYRIGGESFDYRNPDGTTTSLKALPEAEQQKLQDYRTHLSDAMVVADTGALMDFLAGEEAVKDGPAGSVGYCMGGRHVLRVAGAFPETFQASASLHPTRLVGDAPDAPFRDAPKVRGDYYSGFGELDHYTPPEVIAEVEAAFAGQLADYEQIVHAGAAHGYAIADRDVYDPQAACRDWERIFAMYDRVLRA